jgi:antitoxin component YwqK of YwqJK toxin-antitoxin module
LNNINCDGKLSTYYRNGKLKYEYNIINGEKDGEEITYSHDSTERISAIYKYKNGKLDGDYKIYRRSGRYLNTGIYVNDTIAGNECYFDSNGDSLQTIFYIKGKEDSPMKKWLRNGQIFHADYLDETHKKVLYRWTDNFGKEVKREIATIINKFFINSLEGKL